MTIKTALENLVAMLTDEPFKAEKVSDAINAFAENLEAALIGTAFLFMGDYEAGAAYEKNAIVAYDGNLYVCTTATEEAGEAPDAEHFTFFANATPPTVEG